MRTTHALITPILFALVLLPALHAATRPAPVPIPELKAWEASMITWGKKLIDQRAQPFSEATVWYYDGQRIFYQIADYTGDPSWNEAARNARDIYRPYVLKNRGRIPGWRVFPQGFLMDWQRNRDTDSRDAVLALASSSAYAPRGGGPGEALSRETAYCIEAYLAAEKLGQPRNPHLAQSVAWALGHIDQWFVQKSSPNWAPFMFALTCEALIQYYDAVSPDPAILEKIRLGAEACWREAWVPADQAFWYRADNKAHGAPDLNLLVAPVYAWLYLKTGDPVWRDRGDQIFAGGVRKAWLGGGKQFSQNYRWSFQYVAWRRQAEK